MKTGEQTITYRLDGTKGFEPDIWCDLCGWGFTIIGDADDVFHFCHRHKADEVRKFWMGERLGYFDLEKEEKP